MLDKGFFLYCGDFNSQQIPFYQYCQQFIQSGGGAFSWATDLGGSFLNTYSFYTLGSPFFWLSCLLPNSWLPYAMVCLLPFLWIAFTQNHSYIHRWFVYRLLAICVFGGLCLLARLTEKRGAAPRVGTGAEMAADGAAQAPRQR